MRQIRFRLGSAPDSVEGAYINININITYINFIFTPVTISFYLSTVVLINECVDPVYPLHIPTNNCPTVSID